MKRIFEVMALAFSFTMAASAAHAQAKDKEPEVFIGEVIIVGNTITQDRVIRDVLNLNPGQTLRYPELLIAERNVARLGLFKVDPKSGTRPTVRVIETPGKFKDILVKVEEGKTLTVQPLAVYMPRDAFGLALVIEERNFDLLRLPRSAADLYDGSAFRGAGQNLRIGIAVGPLLQLRPYFSLTE